MESMSPVLGPEILSTAISRLGSHVGAKGLRSLAYV